MAAAPRIDRGPAHCPFPTARVLSRRVADAQIEADTLIAGAERRAAELLRAAEADALETRRLAAVEGRNAGMAELAAHRLRFAELEARADERSLDRCLELATLLAERLLGEALKLEPRRIVAIAAKALEEARAAKQIRVGAHPEDRPLLTAEAERLGLSATAFYDAEDLKHGELRIETELGTIEAKPTLELERLTSALRKSLEHPTAP
jgi:flagellar assembly protein FliH/type III secretion protein L